MTELRFANTSFTIDGRAIDALDDAKRVLGKPRTTIFTGPGTTISTWDDKGIYVYCDIGSTFIHHVSMPFVHEDFEFSPHAVFDGTLVLGKRRLSVDDHLEFVKREAKVQSVEIAHTIILRLEGCWVHYVLDCDNTRVASISVSLPKR